MKLTLRRSLSTWFTLAIAVAGVKNCSAAGSPETAPAITIHVRNYAEVDPQTLALAEHVAQGIFRKAGVETQWTQVALTVENGKIDPSAHRVFTPSDVQLAILPESMSNRFNLPGNVMGLAPGMGPNRAAIYVFDRQVTSLFWTVTSAYSMRDLHWQISKGQIMGHAIAHELGHLLLNQPGHSPRGIMSGEWGFPELRDAAYGDLLFTLQQAGVLQLETRRRCARQEIAELN